MLVLTICSTNAQTTEGDSVTTLPWPRNLQSKIDVIVQDPLLDISQLGLMVWDLTADSTSTATTTVS